MRLIFLDFDGVLNHEAWYRAFNAKHGRSPSFGPEHDHEHFDPECVYRVNRICRETHAKIVVSSTWRILHGRAELAAMLSRAGLASAAWVISTTPRLHGGGRGVEIDHWLHHSARQKVESFIILDDDRDMEPHMQRLVHCGYVNGRAVGLTDAIADQAIAMLSESQACSPASETTPPPPSPPE